jgi:hypothetical protein
MADFLVGIVYEYQRLRVCQLNFTPHGQAHCVQLLRG